MCQLWMPRITPCLVVLVLPPVMQVVEQDQSKKRLKRQRSQSLKRQRSLKKQKKQRSKVMAQASNFFSNCRTPAGLLTRLRLLVNTDTHLSSPCSSVWGRKVTLVDIVRNTCLCSNAHHFFHW
mmetsp:Transcript_45455/g.76532  ORF Transcript_45455/g.76532 Transcript_45455/m.76532 type:complete len:123 (-) Transcript_45455:471-839(-)